MSRRCRLLAEAEKEISNPFLLCALISRRMRQLMMTRDSSTNITELVNSALDELIGGALKFEHGGRSCSPLRAEGYCIEGNDDLAPERAPTSPSVALPGEFG